MLRNKTAVECWNILKYEIESIIDQFVPLKNKENGLERNSGIAASKNNKILGLIRGNITYKEKKLIIPLYKAIVRPHLEYCIHAWRPYCNDSRTKRH